MTNWRFVAERFSTGEILDTDLELQSADVEFDVISGPTSFSGTITPALAKYRASDGDLLFDPWGTIIHCEAAGELRTSLILTDSKFVGSEWEIGGMGLAGYPQGMPHRGEYKRTEIDPLQVVRDVWTHIQEEQGSDIGVTVSDAVSPVRVGQVEVIPDMQTGLGEPIYFEEGPITYAWWLTDDLGHEIDGLAEKTPFDYRMRHRWLSGGGIEHFLELGYPKLGTRRNELRFAIGENILEMPSLEADYDSWGNEIQVIGAGEGRDMIVSDPMRINDGRIRKVIRVVDKTIQSKEAANDRARTELSIRNRTMNLDSIVIDASHVNAPIGSFRAGDTIPIIVETDWLSQRLWMRVMSVTRDNATDRATLSLDLAEV